MLLQLGRCQVALNQRRASRQTAEAILAIEPDNAESLELLGTALVRSGRGGRAADAYLEAQRLEPGNRRNQAKLERIVGSRNTTIIMFGLLAVLIAIWSVPVWIRVVLVVGVVATAAVVVRRQYRVRPEVVRKVRAARRSQPSELLGRLPVAIGFVVGLVSVVVVLWLGEWGAPDGMQHSAAMVIIGAVLLIAVNVSTSWWAIKASALMPGPEGPAIADLGVWIFLADLVVIIGSIVAVVQHL